MGKGIINYSIEKKTEENMVELKNITILDEQMPECIALDVAPEQNKYIDSNAINLAWAYDQNLRGKIMQCRAIYADKKMIGLISYSYFINEIPYKETCYRIRPVMIDKNHLGKGYEVAAIKELIKETRTKPHGEATSVYASYDPKEAEMAKIYEAVGFVITDLNFHEENPDDNDIIVRLDI
jgi:RimJ/RimL family protein N-acetyltransferase